ncbi:MAG: cytochrome c oxidase accessory protein CcoG [Burkholderiales bacterium]|nr:cytochrome c oxidase accessory protein CcoG [Burkholderiales bacterium]
MPGSREIGVQPIDIPRPPAAGQPVNIKAVDASLFEVRRKIYPRAVTGRFATSRWALVFLTQAVFYGLAWLQWNGRQAVLFDIAARKFHLFGLVFWPQDIVYLTVLLVISAYSLFFFTALAGRVWCGFACPQTVYTEIFLWIERRIEGDRPARIKLDGGGLTGRKFRLKLTKHGIWIALSLWTGFTFVGYFTPIRELLHELTAFSIGPWEAFWMLFYGFATYGNAGWMREQVCKYMCPYARFQGVMFDPDTLVITYDDKRGEPRGGRARSADPKTKGLGDCVDCGICVQVCPTGIDIRNGLQYECIGCAACIDGCNQVMDKMGYPRGLIRYATENAVNRGWDRTAMLRRLARPRVLLYGTILVAIVSAASFTLWHRVPVKVDVIRDRTPMMAETGDGRVENVYRLQIMNTDETRRRFTVTVDGLPDVELAARDLPLELAGATSRMLPVRVRARPAVAEPGVKITETIVFRIVGTPMDGGAPLMVVEQARFVVP